MSQLLTAPELNQNVRDDKENQTRNVKPIQSMATFGMDPDMKFRSIDTLNANQIDFLTFPQKNQLFTKVEWTTTQANESIFNQEVDLNFIQNVMTNYATDRFMYYDYEYLIVSLEPTNNALYAGELRLIWKPFFTDLYYDRIYDIDINKPEYLMQLQTVSFQPANTGRIEIRIPLTALFKIMQLNQVYQGTDEGAKILKARKTLFKDIRLGTISIYVLSSLSTTSTRLSLSIPISYSIVGAKLAALKT